MSITELYTPSEFFIEVKRSEFKLGQICWVPIPVIDPIPRILDVQRNQPEEHEEVKFELRLANQKDDFRKRDRTLPIKYLKLKSNEELLTQSAKKRPAIILAAGVECYPEIAKLLLKRGKKHLQQDCMFVIPCYGIQQEKYGGGFVPEMVARIQCLMYRQFFFIPKSDEFSEMIARFDRIQVVIDRGPAAIEPSPVCLSEELFNLFLAMFIFCISGQPNDLLEGVKSIVQEAYPD